MARRGIEHKAPSVVAVAVARRVAGTVEDRGGGVEHAAEDLPRLASERHLRDLRLDGCSEDQLRHKAVVLECLLAVKTASEGVPSELHPERSRGPGTPTCRLGEPRERAARDESTSGLGDRVVVRRRSATRKRREITLVPVDLLERTRVVLEESSSPGPAVE